MKLWDDQGFTTGQIVFFGTHMCTDQSGEWIILKTNNEKGIALIAVTESVGMIPYHQGDSEKVTWENCSLRSWLNETYFSNFTAHEKASVCETEIPASDGSPETVKDYVFILSEEESSITSSKCLD